MTRDIAVLVLSCLILLGFSGVVIAWMVHPPAEHNDVLTSLATTLGTGYLAVIYYWFTKPKEPS